MPDWILKKHPTHKKTTDRWIITFSLAGIFSLFLIWYVDVHYTNQPIVPFVILFSLILFFCAMAISFARIHILRCADCRQFTRYIVQQEDDPQSRHFFCAQCNIEWDSGIKIGTPP